MMSSHQLSSVLLLSFTVPTGCWNLIDHFLDSFCPNPQSRRNFILFVPELSVQNLRYLLWVPHEDAYFSRSHLSYAQFVRGSLRGTRTSLSYDRQVKPWREQHPSVWESVHWFLFGPREHRIWEAWEKFSSFDPVGLGFGNSCISAG